MVRPQHAPHHLPGQRAGHRRGVVDELPRQGLGGGHEVLRRVQAADEAAVMGLLRREDPTGIAPFQGRLDAHQPGQEPAGAGLRIDPAPVEHEAVAGGGGGEANVHGQLHGGPDAHGGAIHRGDHGLQAVEDAQGHPPAPVAIDVADLGLVPGGLAALGIVKGRPAGGQVGPGAEGPVPGPGDDHRPHPVVGVGDVEGRDHVQHHLGGEAVHLVGAVEGQDGDPVLDLELDGLEVGDGQGGGGGHGRLSLRSGFAHCAEATLRKASPLAPSCQAGRASAARLTGRAGSSRAVSQRRTGWS